MSQPTGLPVLVIGAGPTGLTLACELARRGLKCRIIDKAAEHFSGSRGKGLQPRTLEVLDDLGVIDAVLTSGGPFPNFRAYAGETVLWERGLGDMLGERYRQTAPTPHIPYGGAWVLPQSRTDAILRERLAELGGHVELATELTGFTQDSHGVTATLVHTGRHTGRHTGMTEQVRAGYLVGADGGRSFVRKELGVGFEGETDETERTLIGDVQVDGLDRGPCHMLTRAGDLRTRVSLWPLPGTNYFQFIATINSDDVPDLTLESIQKMLEERSGRSDLRLHDLTWLSLYRVNVRMAERFRVGRVFLAGDAAHVHSSAGGQGLNTSIQDAYNLGWKLGAVLNGAPDALLETYEAERLPIAADVLGITTKLHQRSFESRTDADGRQRETDQDIYQLRLNYRKGPLSRDERDVPGSIQAGDRAPDAPCHDTAGAAIRLFDIFRGPHFTLLALGTGHAAALAEIRDRHGAFVHAFTVVRPGAPVDGLSLLDSDGHLHRGYDIALDESALVLVRPDGYVGLITPHGSAERVHDYLAMLG